MDSDNQLPIVLEQKNKEENNKIIEPPNDSAFNNLSNTLKEIETLINSLPCDKENESTISSLKEKISLSQTQLSELETERHSNNSNQNVNHNDKIETMDNKMDLIINKMDIMLNLINSKAGEPQGSDEPVEKKYENGDKYIGQMKNGKKHGNGIMNYADKSIYDGEWFNDLKNGQGVQKLANGDTYEGNFKNNLMEGYGIYTFKNGRVYEGQFVKDTMEGKGRYKFTTGNEYIGDFQGGLFMERVLFCILTEIDLKVLIKKGKRMEKGLIILNLEKNSWENGIKMKDMEKVLYIRKMEKLKYKLSKMEK